MSFSEEIPTFSSGVISCIASSSDFAGTENLTSGRKLSKALKLISAGVIFVSFIWLMCSKTVSLL